MFKSLTNKIFEILLVLLILILINVVASYFYNHIDLTEDSRFTISESTKDLVREVDDNLLIQVLMDGQLAAGFKRLKNAGEDMLSEFNSLNSNVEYEFFDPMEGSTEEINTLTQQLKEMGILPLNLRVMDGKETVDKLVYPYAIVNFAGRKVVINLLEEQRQGVPNEIILNNSVSLLEYKFSDAIYRIRTKNKPNIVFTSGNGELDISQTAFLERKLRDRYDTGRIVLDSVVKINQAIDLLIVAKPRQVISERSQFLIDQYVMNGGNIIWLIDRYEVNVDSIRTNGFYVPKPIELGLEDMFFKFGVKYKDNLVLDLDCTRIPQVIGEQGDKPQIEKFNWYYHPLIVPSGNHPITNKLDLVNMFFPSTIDTLKTKADIRKNIILSSSQYSRYQLYPMRLNFEILKFDPDPDKFNKGPQALSVIVEGKFVSLFKNRVGQEMKDMLKSIDSEYKEESIGSKQLFISDGDMIKNYYNPSSQQVSAIGFNIWEETAFPGNEDFIINAIDYMTDDLGLIETRSKELKLHLLNTTKAKEEQTFWQLFNVALPLIFLVFFGLGFAFVRKRKYA